jgi:hypothetical protein
MTPTPTESGSPEPRVSRPPVGRASVYYVAIFLVIFLALDFIYSRTLHHQPSPARTGDPVFHHSFVPNFDGYELWSERQYRLVTNNLGFKDAVVRDVPLKSPVRRVLLVGGSFTEGMGMPFEDTFAGMLAQDGARRAEKTEFLDAGMEEYSPTLFYRQVKVLLERGYVFDEVVVLPDLSNVADEATNYFCFDEVPRYRQLCGDRASHLETRSGNGCDYSVDSAQKAIAQYLSDASRSIGRFLQFNFAVSDTLRLMAKYKLQEWTGGRKQELLSPSPRIGWSIPGYDVGDTYAPLGVEGGVERMLIHMQALADLLAQHHIPLVVAVYPWPLSLVQKVPGGRWVAMWRDFCVKNCKAFVDIFPDFIAAKDKHPDWYERYFIWGDVHLSAAGNKIIFDALIKSGL